MDSIFDGENIYDPPDPNKYYAFSIYNANKGYTLLMKWLLIVTNHPNLYDNIVKLIVDNPNIIDAQTNLGYTALMLASANSNTCSSENMVRLLIESGANIDCQNADGKTALMLAIEGEIDDESTKNTVKILLKAKPNIHLEDYKGMTAMEMAMDSYINDNEIIELFVELDSDMKQIYIFSGQLNGVESSDELSDKIIDKYYRVCIKKLMQGKNITEIGNDPRLIAVLIKATREHTIMKHNYDNVIKKVIVHAKEVKLKDGNIGSKIMMQSYLCKCQSIKEIYNNLSKNFILEYLGVKDENDLLSKINGYIENI